MDILTKTIQVMPHVTLMTVIAAAVIAGCTYLYPWLYRQIAENWRVARVALGILGFVGLIFDFSLIYVAVATNDPIGILALYALALLLPLLATVFNSRPRFVARAEAAMKDREMAQQGRGLKP